jgi:hypothetical protein
MPSPLPRAYLVANTLEPFFLENATRWADALRDAGADIVMTERPSNHGDLGNGSDRASEYRLSGNRNLD